jgi:NAD(P)H-hydrate epimerase
MIDVVSKQTMQAMDRHMIENMHIPSAILMENAAFGITCAVCAAYPRDTRIVAVCGPGNNGGDGFAAARQLRAKGYSVSVCLIGAVDALRGDAAANAAYFDDTVLEITDEASALAHLSGLSDCVIIDAIFGIGLSREVTGLFALVIDLLNAAGADIIACDIPSGIDADTGAVLGTAIHARQTVTFQCGKPGLFLYPGRGHAGALSVKEIGTTGDFIYPDIVAYTDGLHLEPRRPDAHKGVYGKLACVTMSRGFTGAGIMCIRGALRAGAGLITAGIPAEVQSIVCGHVPECMTFALPDADGALSEYCIPALDQLMSGKTALAIGPGLSQSDGAARAVLHAVSHYDIRKVFDADALSIIAQNPDVLKNKTGDIVLTPHIVEFSRLCGLSPDDIRKDPLGTAQAFAAQYGVILLLKGPTTIVTDGEESALVPIGTPGMATGGSGDVLTGVIGGLLAGADAGEMDAFDAALYGAYICGKAGEAAAQALGDYSMTPMDTLCHIADVTRAMTAAL